MIGKGSKTYSVFRNKCPKCQESDVFIGSVFKGVYNMNKVCPVCKQHYELEPGFFWGAMYVGYGFSCAYLLSAFGITMLVFKIDMWTSFAITMIPGSVLMLYFARWSRLVWMNIYIHYRPDAAKKAFAEDNKD